MSFIDEQRHRLAAAQHELSQLAFALFALSGIIARFVPEITLGRVRLCSLGCADPHITCPRNMAARFETVWNMETNKGTVRKPKTGRKLCVTFGDKWQGYFVANCHR